MPAAQEHILAQQDGKARLLRAVTDLSRAFALAVPHEESKRITDDVAFFQAVRAVLAKTTPGETKTDEELDLAIRQIISRAVASDEVMDIFAAAGLKKPDISILSDEFLADVRGMPQRNLAVELLQKLLKGEIKERGKRNVVQARSFAELLAQAVRKYQNRAIEAAQVIEELIQLAKDLRAAGARGEQLGLSADELAFYDALETNDSAVQVLGDETLRAIARELVETVRKNVTIDWAIRENVRAQLRVLVKRILRGQLPPQLNLSTQGAVLRGRALVYARNQLPAGGVLVWEDKGPPLGFTDQGGGLEFAVKRGSTLCFETSDRKSWQVPARAGEVRTFVGGEVLLVGQILDAEQKGISRAVVAATSILDPTKSSETATQKDGTFALGPVARSAWCLDSIRRAFLRKSVRFVAGGDNIQNEGGTK